MKSKLMSLSLVVVSLSLVLGHQGVQANLIYPLFLEARNVDMDFFESLPSKYSILDQCKMEYHGDILPTSNGYRLPWYYCTYLRVTQGWNGSVSHTGSMQYAYDFNHSEGAAVRAAQGGQVSYIKSDVSPDSCCSDSSCANHVNYVVINHSDSKATLYLHLRSVSVGVGTYVGRGQTIGTAGKTGWTSCATHLHFQRQDQGGWFKQSRPVYFEEYPGQELLVGTWYRSNNSWPGDYCMTSKTLFEEDNRSFSITPWTATDTNAWVSYENTAHSLRFHYPAEFVLIPHVWDSPTSGVFGESLHISVLDPQNNGIMGISVHPNLWDTPESFLAEMKRANHGISENMRYPFTEVLTRTEINGYPAVIFRWDNTITGRFQATAVAGPQWLYIFHLPEEVEMEKSRDLLSRMLRTFRILD